MTLARTDVSEDVTLYQGDCRDVMCALEPESVDAIVTDPPYLLEFMGKAFDRQHKGMLGSNPGQKMYAWHLTWAEHAFRVLKPGGYIIAFGGDRTFHRLYSAIEDVGFQPRHTVAWLYGQGFPKSRNVSADLAQVEYCDCDD